jgi:hypothetical protein
MNASKALRAIAERMVWFENADETLRYPKRFLAYTMTYGTLEEILATRAFFSNEEFEAALEDAPAGIFDVRSWTYWNYVYGHYPVPPLPERHIPDVDPEGIPDS